MRDVPFIRTLPSIRIGDHVTIDGGDVRAVVTALCLRQNGWSAECAWWSHGDLKEAWVTLDRLERAHD